VTQDLIAISPLDSIVIEQGDDKPRIRLKLPPGLKLKPAVGYGYAKCPWCSESRQYASGILRHAAVQHRDRLVEV
jgi:hypothetical protein